MRKRSKNNKDKEENPRPTCFLSFSVIYYKQEEECTVVASDLEEDIALLEVTFTNQHSD